MQTFGHYLLLKRGLRTDGIWTTPLCFKSLLARIPLYADTAALMKSQYWPREDIERMQQERLRDLFQDATGVPFWRDTFKSAGVRAEDSVARILAKLPVISKQNLVPVDVAYHTNPALLRRSDGDRTSGSTGRPFHFYFDWGASLRSYGVTERIFRTAGGGTRFPIVYLRSRPRNGFTFIKHIWVKSLGYRDVSEKIEALERVAAQFPHGFILYAYTSSMLHLAREIERRKVRLPLRGAMVAGEHISSSEREYLARVLKTELFTLYASREAGFLAYECERHALHLSEEWAYVEIVDEHGMALPSGQEGRVAVTTFDNRVMPFIRYDIGDRGVISAEQCGCGRTLRTITLKGRTAEIIELGGGRTAALLDISATIDRYWGVVTQFQLVQTALCSFTVRIVPGPRFSEGKIRLERALREIVGSETHIEWEIAGSIEPASSGKANYFVRAY